MSRQLIMYNSTTGDILHTLTRGDDQDQFTEEEAQAFVDEKVAENGYQNVAYLLITAGGEIIQSGKWKVNLDTLHLESAVANQISYE